MSELKIQENVILAPYTTFRIGGPAKYFFEAKSKEELIQAIEWAKNNRVRYFILGAGSNILISDKGFDGLVIKVKNEKLKIKNYISKFKIIEAGAGVRLNKLVEIGLKRGLSGLEWAVGIPGTLGGAVRGNAGAMGHSISEAIKSVEVLDTKNKQILETKNFLNCDCLFDYRNSVFKHNRNLVILAAKLELKPGDQEESRNKIQEYLEKRKNQPSEPSAGSIFKNPLIANRHEFEHKFHEYQPIPFINSQIPAGWLIEQCGLKGYKIGQAQVSSKHANFIVNLGKAKAEEVTILINLIKKKVRDKFGIRLEEEIQYLGDGHQP